MKNHWMLGAGLVLMMVGAVAGCTGGKTGGLSSIAVDGSPQHGRALIARYGCGACHVIPGIHAARGLVGPPLFYWSRRTIIAGELPNNPGNLERWIENPPAIEPGTAMPNLGVTPAQARDMAAYLYTLQ
jgi:cytochrome c1